MNSCGIPMGCGSSPINMSCGAPMGGCGRSPVYGERSSQRSSIYMLPKEINLEKETVKFRTWRHDEKLNDVKLPFKKVRKYQKGEFNTDNIEYFVCGIKIDKNGEPTFTKKGKDYIKRFLEDGNKAWKEFKKLKAEIKEELETLKEQNAEEEEDLEM